MSETKSFGIIGTGRMGKAIGARLAGLGHAVVYGSRDPSGENATAAMEAAAGSTATSLNEAAQNCDMVIIAVPWAGLEESVKALGDLSGKIVIDVTNAMVPSADGLMEMAAASSAEHIAEWLPGARIVKALNTIGAHVIADPTKAEGPVTSPMCSDDAEAKETVTELVKTMGLDTADVGPLRIARGTEPMAMVYIVPLLQGRLDDAFEFYFRTGALSTNVTVRAAG